MDIDINVRCILCLQKTHILDRKFNMSVFNYSTVNVVSGGGAGVALRSQENSWS